MALPFLSSNYLNIWITMKSLTSYHYTEPRLKKAKFEEVGLFQSIMADF